MELKGKTALLTGGCGFIGSHIVDLLIRDEKIGRVVIIDNLTRGALRNIEWARQHGEVELVRRDIRRFEDIRPYFNGVDLVFHLAALRITACGAEPRECLEVMIDGAYNVVEASVQAGVKRFVASSTASVYGAADSFPTSEEHHPYNNRTWYGAAKLANEGLYRAFNDIFGLPYVALRYFNVHGPRMDVFGKYTEVLIRWLECLDRGERPKIFGNGQTSMDFVYVEDVARANIFAAKSEIVDDVFNIGSGAETTLLELLQMLLKITGRTDVQPEFLPERKINPVPRRLADVTKAEKKLGFRARVGLEEGLRKLVEWRRQVISAHHYTDYASEMAEDFAAIGKD
ncbi:MAG: NAD-dependent epimerase/dehydratase family protein [Acidobacteria bacterium]|nr:NAD-dependent epimerase/dehydratase family protein [Acidobacteriota bacterium]